MDVFKNKALRRALLIIAVVSIPIWLSELFFPRELKPLEPALPAPHEEPKAELRLASEPRIDRERFLASFTRQAGAKLDSCLQEALGPSGSITLMARINKNGLLSGVRLIEPQGLDCAVEAVREMKFEAAGRTLDRDSAEVGWRYDW